MYDAIIIGSGTVGLTMANLLGSLGLRICLLEKNNEINSVSNAVGINDECLFAWKICGILEEISNYIAHNENGEIILKYLDKEKREILSLEQSSGIRNFPKGVVFLQNKIDRILLKNLQKNCDIFFEEELIDVKQNAEKVTAKTQNKTFEAKYLIAADGKYSTVRDILRIKLNELSKSKDEWLILNLLVKNHASLANKFVEVFCGKRSLVSCPLPQNYHRIEVSLAESEENLINDEDRIRELLKHYVNFENYQIIDKFKIRFVTAIVEKYYSNRIALCGDAAHRTSPFASSGLISGIRDALVLYEIFKEGKIDFAKYEKQRYTKQMRSLKLAMKLEKIMRPNKFSAKFLFFFIRILSRSKMFVKYLSIRS